MSTLIVSAQSSDEKKTNKQTLEYKLWIPILVYCMLHIYVYHFLVTSIIRQMADGPSLEVHG